MFDYFKLHCIYFPILYYTLYHIFNFALILGFFFHTLITFCGVYFLSLNTFISSTVQSRSRYPLKTARRGERMNSQSASGKNPPPDSFQRHRCQSELTKSPSSEHSSKKNIVDLRARYWKFLFDNFQRAVDAIYQTCEQDESVVECKVCKLQIHLFIL